MPALLNVFRYDTVRLKGKATIDSDGYVRAEAVCTRAGVFFYQNNDGTTRREFRPPLEVFNPDSMNTLKLKPMTNGHPPEKLLNVDNAKDYTIGMTGETIKRDDNDLLTSLVITDSKAVKDVDLGKQELSCGYTCDLAEETGTWNNEKYDHVQTNIRYNHLALCTTARAGHGAKLNFSRTDGFFERNDAVQVESDSLTIPIGGTMPDNTKKDDADFEKKYNDLKDKHEALKKEFDEFKAKQKDDAKAAKDCSKKDDEMTANIDALKGERDSLKLIVDSIPQKIADAIKNRRSLEVNAAKVLPDMVSKFDAMQEQEIKSAVIVARFPELKLDDKSPEYVTACFDMAITTPKLLTPAELNKMVVTGAVLDTTEAAKVKFDSEEARKSMHKHS
jgi:hypothetical protein